MEALASDVLTGLGLTSEFLEDYDVTPSDFMSRKMMKEM